MSHGHYAETSEALVRVSPEAFEQYQEHTVGGEFEPGSTLVMLHRSRVDRKPGRVHVMQREPSGWYYLVLEADGAIVEQGALPGCTGCHADAVSDSVFGPPRSEAPE